MSEFIFRRLQIPDVIEITPTMYYDSRGWFREFYHSKVFKKAGIECDFVQDNVSISYRGVLRGLHYQKKHPQAKLVSVISGDVYDVVVDLRKDSPTFRNWVGIFLSDRHPHQLFIPAGFAHGFLTLSSVAIFFYKCSDYYDRTDDYGIHYTSIPWKFPFRWKKPKPIEKMEIKLSEKDAFLPMLDNLLEDDLP